MARSELKATSVYMDKTQDKILKKAAALENRSVSNFVLTHALDAAEKLGVVGAKTAKQTRHRQYT